MSIITTSLSVCGRKKPAGWGYTREALMKSARMDCVEIFLSERGACLQKYWMYFKNMQRIYGEKFSQDIDDAFHQWFPNGANGKERANQMVEQDTIKLLRECDAGVQMGISSIDDVLGSVRSDGLKRRLSDCKVEHERLDREIQGLLKQYHDDGKEPNPMAKGMSWIKTNMKLAMDGSDGTVADLMTDGCNMGVKSLNQYLNQYKAADERSKDVAKRLINLEEKLAVDIRQFL